MSNRHFKQYKEGQRQGWNSVAGGSTAFHRIRLPGGTAYWLC
jgi:hypothetical protein